MRTTQDCKEFLVGFLKDNPQIVGSLFPGDEEAQKEAVIARNWKRTSKIRSTNDQEFDEGYTLYENGRSVNRYCEGHRKVSVSDFVWTRSFNNDQFESGLAFLVLENASGELFLGNYVGD